MLRTAIGLFTAFTLIPSTAQASPYAGVVPTAALSATPGYAVPGEPAPAEPGPQPYEAQPGPAPAPYGEPVAAQPYGPQAGPAPYQPPAQPQRRRGKGMMIGGFVTFGASYLSTALVGAVALDASSEVLGGDPRGRRLGASLLVPVVGPLIAIPSIESATGTMFSIFSFIVQAGGLSLGIAGAVRYSRDGKRIQAAQAGLNVGKGVRLGAAPRLGGATLNLSYRF